MIELMIAIAVLAVLVAMALPSFELLNGIPDNIQVYLEVAVRTVGCVGKPSITETAWAIAGLRTSTQPTVLCREAGSCPVLLLGWSLGARRKRRDFNLTYGK